MSGPWLGSRPEAAIRWERGQKVPSPPKAGMIWCSWVESGKRWGCWFIPEDLYEGDFDA